MLNRIKSIFKKREASKVKDVKTLVEKILGMNLVDIAKDREGVRGCLNLMEIEVKRIRSQANGYPKGTISGDVWFDGVALASMGEALASHLSDEILLEEQSEATSIWTNAVLSVCSHYYHMVGPAMIANALVKEKTGYLEYSKSAYSAVLQDFECVLEYVEDSDCKPEGDDLIALKSLETACKKLVELRELSGVNSRAPGVLTRIAIAMEKTDESDGRSS